MDRGVLVRELGRLELAELELDEPGAGEGVVRLEATGVCHSDLHVLETGFNHPLPVLLGHEGAGVVEAVGEGVELEVGERVVLGWRSPCGECRWCSRGDERRCRTPPRAARRLLLRSSTTAYMSFLASLYLTFAISFSARFSTSIFTQVVWYPWSLNLT